MKATIQILVLCACLVILMGCQPAPAEEPAAPTRTAAEAALIQSGKNVFTAECARCHALEGETVIVGPSLAGIASRAGERVSNQDATQYIMQSIMRPDAYLVDGFENLMPTGLGKELTGEEIDGVIAYLLTLE